MFNNVSMTAIVIFLAFVGFVLGLSFWLGRKAKDSTGYFAAHGQIPWFVNGIAFAGDYLSAASFLGICGMIALYGYDGFLYSIGFLAGWVVALFVIAEPIKKLGKFTFADALDAKFGSPGIKLAAAISTLVVSLLYLIPQMVGAGALLKALLGLPGYDWCGIDLHHALGVFVVGAVVILIVVTAGMVSTTWVQFIKGSLLVIFCAVLAAAILHRGVKVNASTSATLTHPPGGGPAVWKATYTTGTHPPTVEVSAIGKTQIPSGPVDPAAFIGVLSETDLVKWKRDAPTSETWTGTNVDGATLMTPGGYFTGLRSESFLKRLDFISLMLALFGGTASLPHVLIRYYTVKDAAAARKSTVVGITAIGLFYILTFYIGLGAMISGNLDPGDASGNMAAPLLARTFGEKPFALITAIAFTTILGTVSGLLLAAAGAVAHDMMGIFAKKKITGDQQVRIAKMTCVAVGLIAIVLGILFKNMNVGFLVGWAFNVAASANLPAIIMLLFWRGTTRKGMIASILVGLISSVTWLLLTKEALQNVYGLKDHAGIVPFSQPGILTIPLAFIVLVAVSLVTEKNVDRRGVEA